MQQAHAAPSNTIEVTLKHSGTETRIIGNPDTVLSETLAYFSKVYPAIQLVSQIVLTTDTSEFLQSCTGIISLSPEGPVVLRKTDSLKDKELMLLQLTSGRLMHLTGKRDTDSMTLEEVVRLTGRTTGTVAGRLSELNNDQLVERVGKGAYRLTTMGTRVVMKNILPKLSQLPER
jgi:hypothetical protein